MSLQVTCAEPKRLLSVLAPFLNWPREMTPTISLNIFFSDDSRLYEKILEQFRSLDRFILPPEILILYEIKKKLLNALDIPEEHPNRYHHHGNYRTAHFSYTTDNFFVEYEPNSRNIWIVGTPFNVQRLILDILMLSAPIAPLHAMAVEIHSTGHIFAGDSGTGKTRLLIDFLQRDAKMLSNDVVFVLNDKIIPFGGDLVIAGEAALRVPILERDSNIRYKRQLDLNSFNNVILGNITPVSNINLLLRTMIDRPTIHSMEQPFPIFPKHSFWCLPLINPNHDEYFSFAYNYLSKSIEYWESLFQKAKMHKINLNQFELFASDVWDSSNSIT